MTMLRKYTFELSFIATLSASGGFLFSALFGLSLISALSIAFILLAVFLSFFIFISLFLGREKVEKELQNKKRPYTHKEKFEFIAIETNNTNKQVQKLQPQPLVKPAEKVEIKKEIKKSPLEQFKENPIGELEQTRDFIISLLNKTQSSYNRIERIFGERMHKNTKTDIQSFLYLKQLNESLSKRLEQVIDLLDLAERDSKLSLARSFELACGPLSFPKDSFNALMSENNNDSPPLPKDEWEAAVSATLKKLSRKKTFHHAINYALYN